MQANIHPNAVEAKIICGCGNVIETLSTRAEIHVDVCSACHPFFTGQQRFIDTEGRVEKFQKRFGDSYRKQQKRR